MASVVWSVDALDDIRDIHAYIAEDSIVHADRMIRRIQAATDRLGIFPESGRVIRESEISGYRQVLVGQYRVIYTFDRHRDEVVITSVIHGRRQLPPLRS